MFRKLLAATTVTTVALFASVEIADAATTPPTYTLASMVSDSRINESSSLVVSSAYPGMAYTANDENDPVYTVDISTGQVMGSSRLVTTQAEAKKVTRYVRKKCSKATGVCTKRYFLKRHKNTKKRKVYVSVVTQHDVDLSDPEAMSMDASGRVWLADLGDNDLSRHGGALYAFDQPGPGNRDVVATRYPIAYPNNESLNVETLLINPVTNAKFVVSKTTDGSSGRILALPTTLDPNATNVAVDLGKTVPTMISDGDISASGAEAVLRDGTKGSESAYVYRTSDWTQIGTVALPATGDKGESLSFDPNGRQFLVGFEGSDAPLYWVPTP